MHHALILVRFVVHHDHGSIHSGFLQNVLLELLLDFDYAFSTNEPSTNHSKRIDSRIDQIVDHI